MFGSKKAALFVDQQIETIIGRGTQIKGTITAVNSGVRIDGQLEGNLISTGDVIVGDSGTLNAQLKARNAVISGLVNGDMDVEDKLELMPTAKVYGDIKAGMLIIGEGAVFKGACEMHKENTGFNKSEDNDKG
jgi:cytoskeletal protein CcmA (bactofilin family)